MEMNDKQFVEYVKKHGWIKSMNDLSLSEQFQLQRDVGCAIEKSINRCKNIF